MNSIKKSILVAFDADNLSFIFATLKNALAAGNMMVAVP